MAIRMRMRWDGVTPDQYDQVRGIVAWETEYPTGGMLHEVWFEGDQLNVCDIWETAEAFNSFVETRLMPGVAQVGIQGQPSVEILPVYNWQLEKPFIPGAVVEEDEGPADSYMALEAEVKWRVEPPIGGISHVAVVDGDLVRSVSVWESQDDHDNFVANRIGPAAEALGATAAPEPPNFHPLHALFHPEGGADRS